ncbi:dnaJ domain-containing protein [Artemisia annua]|uniref:DnaJ domain-containing protein n=1 Tax=Artemisia annua TaxID=35608 RepID=A0A2U1L668_ARTAN|nr:dnaJ domain-containing protein [Artemisia annua]
MEEIVGREKGLQLSTKDIKKAYKLKALELHPDKKPNNTNAVTDFQKLQASYNILKDEYTRKVFDSDLMIRLKEQQEENLEFEQSDV